MAFTNHAIFKRLTSERVPILTDTRKSGQAIEMLQRVPIFSGLNKKYLKNVAEKGTEQTFEAGQTIVREGELGFGLFLVLEGATEVRKSSKVVAKLGRGQFFGELSLLDKQMRSADVVAVEPTKCLVIKPWDFSAFIRLYPEVAEGVLRELASRLRATTEALAY